MTDDLDVFVPRWGETVFDCKFCGSEGMQWTEIAPDRWKPFDLLNDTVHDCMGDSAEKMTQDDILEHLQNFGFEAYRPRTSSWKFVFTASNKTQSLYFLIGRRSIDFKFYESGRSLETDDRGRLFTDGGVLVRNYYKDSDVNIHELVLELASRFISNSPIDKEFFIGRGTSWAEQKAKYIRSLPKDSIKESRYEMRDIYDAIANEPGEDAYLGDGMWISSDGSVRDKGR